MSNIMKLIETYPYLLYGSILITGVFLSGSLFRSMFNVKDESFKQKRNNQLNKVNLESSKKETDSTKRLIKNLSNPLYENYVKDHDYDEIKVDSLERKLRIAGWDKYMGPLEFLAFDMTLKAFGAFFAIFFLLLGSWQLSLIFLGVLGFLPRFLLNNSVTERAEKLTADFPDFISILGGYLQGGKDLIVAAEMTKKYLNKEWQDIIDKFVAIGRNQNQLDALEYLRDEVNVFAIQEIVSLLRLSIEQGIDPSEGIKQQYSVIREMYKDSMLSKIAKRKVFAFCVQGPVLLMSMVTFGLPTFYQMFTFSALK